MLFSRVLRDARPSRTPSVTPPPDLSQISSQPTTSPNGKPSPAANNVKQQSRHISFYRIYGRPIVRVFLMSSIVYYSLHYLWWRLEYDEMEVEKRQQVGTLAEQLGDAIDDPTGVAAKR